MTDRFCILCCENIRPEVDAVLATGTMPRATALSFPFHCGHVRSVWKTVREQFDILERAGTRVCLCGCGCSNTMDIPEEVARGSTIVFRGAGASLFLPEDLLTHYQKNGVLLVLPGWLSRWKQNASCDGLDKATARQMYAESAREIILLDTGTHPGTAGLLEEYAAFLGLPARVLPVGVDHFRLRLMESYLSWQCEEEIAGCRTEVREAEKKVADYSMVSDLTTQIIGTHDEKTVILRMLELFFLLCSPKRTGFRLFQGNVAGEIVSIPPAAYEADCNSFQSLDPESQYRVSATGDGFLFRVLYNKDLIGILSVDGVAFPAYLDEYLNLAHFIVQVAGLSITIARTHQDLVQTVTERNAEIAGREKTEDALNVTLKKLNMLSSITRHDILNQIMGLRTYLELSRQDLKDTRFAGFIEKEDQAAAAIQRQIEFTKYYQDIGVNAPKWQDAAEIIRTAIAQLNIPTARTEVTIRGVEIFADPLIVKVFFNLVENSLRHGGHVTRMDFSSRESGDGLIITYSDNGGGISHEDKERLFQRGFGKHTGLGLFLSREILAITGITITENGEPGAGVRFEITVPDGAYRYTS